MKTKNNFGSFDAEKEAPRVITTAPKKDVIKAVLVVILVIALFAVAIWGAIKSYQDERKQYTCSPDQTLLGTFNMDPCSLFPEDLRARRNIVLAFSDHPEVLKSDGVFYYFIVPPDQQIMDLVKTPRYVLDIRNKIGRVGINAIWLSIGLVFPYALKGIKKIKSKVDSKKTAVATTNKRFDAVSSGI